MILGLVREFPAHSYDVLKILYRDFAEQGPEINKGQLYSLVQKMEEEGLIVRETISQEKNPNRKLIEITPKGEADFNEWLRTSNNEYENIRYDFFSKYYFLYKVHYFNQLTKEQISDKLTKQITLMEEKLDNFLGAREDMAARQVDFYRMAVIEYGIHIQRTKISWLKDLLKDVEAR